MSRLPVKGSPFSSTQHSVAGRRSPLMMQAPNQRQYYRQLFRNLVYQALVA